jgi:hypothetical protein
VQLRNGCQAALISDREATDLGDLVAPELHPQRVIGGGWENVDDAAAYGELTPPVNHVDPGVGELLQPR